MNIHADYNAEQIRNGSKSEFEKIYSGFFDVLYALGFQYTADQSVAESIVQDAFLKLWEVRESLVPGTNVKNFLYTVTKNLCLNHLRNQKTIWKHLNQVRHDEYDYAIESLSRLGESYLEFEELRTKADQSIENLPEELKIVFKMSRFEDLKYREIAERLHISEKTVEARMTKALKLLRAGLKEYLALFYWVTHHFIEKN
ncbi:RNA polymerase sigma-70 factor [Gaoshiqia sp. Z1-71]|uniref:RNA polymerase sigma-70 factor n=1 Tax=Gaoshiqia hydrogeniformans TaxID=3290090 RepID=UPI003BF78AA3